MTKQTLKHQNTNKTNGTSVLKITDIYGQKDLWNIIY